MRKNTARKWVHLLLDLLPVLIIPIFAIFLINHNPQGLQVQTGGYEYHEKYQTNDVNSANDLIVGNVYKLKLSELQSALYLFNESEGIYFKLLDNLQSTDEIWVDESFSVYQFGSNTYLYMYFEVGDFNIQLFTYYEQYFETDANVNYSYDGTFYNDINIQLLDKVGIFTNSYQYFEKSDYSEMVCTYNEGMIYDNTDIGSQLIYSMYIPVHDYFNMTNLFNFGDIYTWINNSMFSGNAPLPIFIVYNVIVYEFLIDLIFLIYSIFMFIIDFSSELLARCFSFSNKGGTR